MQINSVATRVSRPFACFRWRRPARPAGFPRHPRDAARQHPALRFQLVAARPRPRLRAHVRPRRRRFRERLRRRQIRPADVRGRFEKPARADGGGRIFGQGQVGEGVTKIPRFAFEKFPQADPTLTTQMKSVGEAMAIGRTFKESLQKCLRSLEIGRSGLGGDGKPWRIGTEVYGDRDILPRDVISRKLSVPNAERIFFIRHALRAGFTIEEIFGLTKIDRWFLVQIKEIVDFEEELAGRRIEIVVIFEIFN